MNCEYRLKDLKPIKTVFETDPKVQNLAELVKSMGCLRPIVAAKENRLIVDGNKLWLALKTLYGEDHMCQCYMVDVVGYSIWVAHTLLNCHDFPVSIEAILGPRARSSNGD